MLQRHQDAFSKPKGLPPIRSRDHKIPLKEESQPINLRPYRVPYIQKVEIEKQIKKMLLNGIIQPSSSPYAVPVILVHKKDESWRMCIDYRRLNDLTIKNKYSIPLIDELLDELNGATWFTKLNLRAGYHQIRVYPSDIPKTAFKTHHSLYEFLVMPFSLTNAPTTFQSFMNDVFKDQLRKSVLVFFDDILVYSPTLEIHIEHLNTVLEILRKQKLYAKESKCSFTREKFGIFGASHLWKRSTSRS